MKKLSFFVGLPLVFSSIFSQTQISLTFQAKDPLTQNPLALDSVTVRNLTKNCDTTLYDAVSVLNINALWPAGILDPESWNSESFILMQNVPNPFRGPTLVRIYLKNAGELNLAVYNNQGKTLSQYRNGFEKGWHLFGISTQGSQQVFLNVFDDRTTKTIKLISAAPCNEVERISYKGQIGQGSILKSAPDIAGFIFYLGNQLQYTAYVAGYPNQILLDNPVSSETYTFTMFFICGDSITIDHDISGGVAPVNKITTYGTVTNIPGAPLKCWITSNLGADHQSTAARDTTEASGGWYWQFNRKQGYKYDSTIRTPNTTWISSINDNLDWLTANDPCNIELGTMWRIPTFSEWYSVDYTCGWTNLSGPWISGLKLHAAGYLYYQDGSLIGRGLGGHYWSSTQYGATSGQFLWFSPGTSYMGNPSKAYGFSIRCLRDI